MAATTRASGARRVWQRADEHHHRRIAEQQHAFDRRVDEGQRPEIDQRADVVTGDAGDDRREHGARAGARLAIARRELRAGRWTRSAIQANSGIASTARTATSSSKPTPRWYSALANSPLLANSIAAPATNNIPRRWRRSVG